ncbi:MAG TPA: hypothetical protein VFR36_09335 [Sphingomicrobium sp.]|nr:hypothetical protein [Sphingomicrobium sp.]
MADTRDFKPQSANPNQTMQHEKAKAEVGGRQRQDERDKLDQERHQQRQDEQEKSAIGGQQPTGQTGEPGRARSELDPSQKDKAPSGQR